MQNWLWICHDGSNRISCDSRCLSYVLFAQSKVYIIFTRESPAIKNKKKCVNVPLSFSVRASPLSTVYTTLFFGSTFDGNVSAAALIQVCNDPIAVTAVTPPINQTCPVCEFVCVSVRARVD